MIEVNTIITISFVSNSTLTHRMSTICSFSSHNKKGESEFRPGNEGKSQQTALLTNKSRTPSKTANGPWQYDTRFFSIIVYTYIFMILLSSRILNLYLLLKNYTYCNNGKKWWEVKMGWESGEQRDDPCIYKMYHGKL